MKSSAALVNRFRASLTPRERWTPSEWAERAPRMLSEHESSEPGPWRNDRTPYLTAILDAFADPNVEEICCVKGAQLGWSEAVRNLIGYCIDIDPGPCLVVMPDQKSAEDYRDERLQPLLDYTEAVRRHVTSKAWDQTKHRVKLDTMSVYLAWAGSSQGLKSRPIRYLFLEEPDEYPSHSGNAGDPISKAFKRITTYADKGRARVVIGGTPTLRSGNVWKRWESINDRRYRWLPCPHCETLQRLVWARVKWPKVEGMTRRELAHKIEAESSAYYECENPACARPIFDHQKPLMLRRGQWGSETDPTPTPFSKRVAFHLSGLYSPWVSFTKLAVEWLAAQDDPQAVCDFVNQRLAEPAEQLRVKTQPDFIADKAKGSPPPLVVPRWAKWLLASADTQGSDEASGYFYWTIRAWGPGYRSQLVDHGIANTKDELRYHCLERTIPVENGGGPVAPQLLLIDSGGPRWEEIYQLAQRDQRVKPSKGDSQRRQWMVEERRQKAHDVTLWLVDTDQAKDLLHNLIHDPDRTKWLPNAAVGETYCRQMASEAKVFDPSEGRERWVELIQNNNHYFDCEALQVVMAWRLGAAKADDDAPPQDGDHPTEAAAAPSWANAHRGRY